MLGGIRKELRIGGIELARSGIYRMSISRDNMVLVGTQNGMIWSCWKELRT